MEATQVTESEFGAGALSIESIFKEAWEKIAGCKSLLMGSLIFFGVSFFIFNLLFSRIFLGLSFGSQLALFLSGLFVTPIGAGLLMLGIRRATDQPLDFKILLFTYRNCLPIWGVYILLSLVFIPIWFWLYPWTSQISFFLNFLVLVLSLMFEALIFPVYPMVILKKYDSITAIVKAIKITLPVYPKLFFIIFLMHLFLFLASIPFGIGLIWAFPFMLVVEGIIYRQLVGIQE